MNYKRGKDISRHQGDIDMPRLAETTDELLMRGTMGGTGFDERFAEYWRESSWAGVKTRGVYHLPIVNIPWRDQRENILRTTRGDFGNGKYTFDYEMRAIDLEAIRRGWRWPKEQFTHDMFELYQSLKREGPVGFRAYGNDGSISSMLLPETWLLELELHVAAYPWTRIGVTYEQLHDLQHAGTYRIVVPRPWSLLPVERQIAAWQGAYTGRYGGVAGNVDLSLIYTETPPLPTPSNTLRDYQRSLLIAAGAVA